MEELISDLEYQNWLNKQDQESMSEENLKKFEEWFVNEIQNNGLRDIKFDFGPENPTEEDITKLISVLNFHRKDDTIQS